MYGYVYKTTNLLNNKIYIGQHKGSTFDPYYYGSGLLLKNIIKKYGKENFKCEVLEECNTPEELNEREIYWIEFYQSRKPSIGYNLAKGGDQVVVGCTEQEIKSISKLLFGSTDETIHDTITKAQAYGLRVYKKGEEWVPSSTNSCGIKMIAADTSIIVSFYTKRQLSITKCYAEKYNCNYWKYNLMVAIHKIPELMKEIKIDFIEKRIIPESFKGPARGTTGVFMETNKYTKSARMPLYIISE